MEDKMKGKCCSPVNRSAGFSLLELLIAMAVFSILVAGIYSAYSSQMRHTAREFRNAELGIEELIAKNILERDIELGGFGLAEDYTGVNVTTSPVLAPDKLVAYLGTDGGTGGPDTLTILGTALGINDRAAQHWTYFDGNKFHRWLGDDGVSELPENPVSGERVVVLEASTKRLLGVSASEWVFSYPLTDPAAEQDPQPTHVTSGTVLPTPPLGSLIYGLADADEPTQPFWAVRYYIGSGDPLSYCAGTTNSLLRAESTSTISPSGSGSLAVPMFNCVRDFQIALGLDTDEDGDIDTWDDGGQEFADDYTGAQFRKRVKEVRLFILSHAGGRDPRYIYPSSTIRVGSLEIGVGRDIALSTEERNYRWRVISLSITPRNLR